MLSGNADLCKLASKLESKKLKGSKFHPDFMLELEALLLDVYASLLPTASEYEQRKQLIYAYDMTVKSIFGNTGGFPVVEAFGSFIMDIFTAKSDLDLSINFSSSSDAACLPRDQVISVLRRLAKILYKKQGKGHLSGVLPILHARVPVLKAVDCKTGIECDISVENKDGISRSLFFSIISWIDERFRIMSYLMKAWAKANDINSSKDRTMNSLTIISLVAFHFQTRDPPILPPFSTLLTNGADITNLRNVVLTFKNFGARNKESVAELFVALLAKLTAIEKLWELGLCASIFEGSWVSKTWGSKVGNMSIEDFLDHSENFARSVGKFEMTKIYNCLRGSLEILSRSMKGQIEFLELRSVLFGSTSFNTQSNLVKTKKAKFNKKKRPIQSVQPIVDVINGGDLAKIRKHNRSDSPQAHVDTMVTTNHANSNTTMTLKKNLIYNEPLAIPRNHSSLNLTYYHEQNPPSIELSQRGIKTIAPKKACNPNTAATSYLGSPRSRSTRALPSPIRHPTLLHVPPEPIGVVSYPHMPFEGSGHPFYRDPMHPVHASTGHRPYNNHLIHPSEHPMAHIYPAYEQQGPHNFPNPINPLIYGYPIHRRGNPHYPLPSRGF